MKSITYEMMKVLFLDNLIWQLINQVVKERELSPFHVCRSNWEISTISITYTSIFVRFGTLWVLIWNSTILTWQLVIIMHMDKLSAMFKMSQTSIYACFRQLAILSGETGWMPGNCSIRFVVRMDVQMFSVTHFSVAYYAPMVSGYTYYMTFFLVKRVKGRPEYKSLAIYKSDLLLLYNMHLQFSRSCQCLQRRVWESLRSEVVERECRSHF